MVSCRTLAGHMSILVTTTKTGTLRASARPRCSERCYIHVGKGEGQGERGKKMGEGRGSTRGKIQCNTVQIVQVCLCFDTHMHVMHVLYDSAAGARNTDLTTHVHVFSFLLEENALKPTFTPTVTAN